MLQLNAFTAHCHVFTTEVDEIRRCLNGKRTDRRPLGKSWHALRNESDDSHFTRMFRMSESRFDTLCDTVCEAVGEETFEPQEHIDDLDFGSFGNASSAALGSQCYDRVLVGEI